MHVLADLSVLSTNDPNVKAYHTRFEMVSSPEIGSRGSSEELSYFSQIILDIRGITQVHVGPYILMVTKAPLFNWSEIDMPVEEVLRHFVASQKQLKDITDGKVSSTNRIKQDRAPGTGVRRKVNPAN